MTVAQHIAQLRQLVLEYPEASNKTLIVDTGDVVSFHFEVHNYEDLVAIERREDSRGTRT
jgi:hypothetical protein